MQPCVRCGWDTRSGSRICTTCRAAESNVVSAPPADPDAEKEALLTAVLRSARGADPAIDEEIAAPERLGRMPGSAAGPEERLIAVLHADAGNEADDEHIALHEVDPDEIDDIASHDDITAVDTGELTIASDDHNQSEVATSLAEALDNSEHIIRRTDLPPPPSDVGGFNGLTSSEIGHDTAEDLAALFNAPSPWDHDPTLLHQPPTPPQDELHPDAPAQPGQQHDEVHTAPPPPTYDTADDLAALFNAPSPWDHDPTQHERDRHTPAQAGQQHDEAHTAPPPPTYDTADDLAALFNAPSPWDHDPTQHERDRHTPAQPGQQHDEPVVYRHAIGGFADPAMADPVGEPADSWDTGNRDATYSPAEWPWVGKSGDGGFWAPPTDGGEPVVSSHSNTWTDARGAGAHDDMAYNIPDEAVATDQEPNAPDAQQPDAKAGTGKRLRTSFQELGAWTAVAQVALLAVGMLCIIQVFVLIVVNSYLSEARIGGGDVATDSLAAHAKVDGVMLPTLLVFAMVAFVFATWRNVASGAGDSGGTSWMFGKPLGVPIALWRILLAAITLLVVILQSPPTGVAAAQRITQWAIFACVLLGAACFAAPRGLEASSAKANDDGAPRHQSGGATGGGVPPRAGSTSVA